MFFAQQMWRDTAIELKFVWYIANDVGWYHFFRGESRKLPFDTQASWSRGYKLMTMKSAPMYRVAQASLADADDVKEAARPTIKQVVGASGHQLTLADLPLANTKRWVIRRKAAIVAAVRGGLLSADEACSRYALNPDELLSWQDRIDCFGLPGLRTTWSQFYLRGMAKPNSLRNPV